MRTLVAIPVYNEEAHVARVLEEVRQYAQDVLVIDDGSTDTTPQLLAPATGRGGSPRPEPRLRAVDDRRDPVGAMLQVRLVGHHGLRRAARAGIPARLLCRNRAGRRRCDQWQPVPGPDTRRRPAPAGPPGDQRGVHFAGQPPVGSEHYRCVLWIQGLPSRGASEVIDR